MTDQEQISSIHYDVSGYRYPYQQLLNNAPENNGQLPLRSLSFEELTRAPQLELSKLDSVGQTPTSAASNSNTTNQPASAPEQNEQIKQLVSFITNHPACPEVIAVVGPTASGKTHLADELAALFSSAVLSVDSMQIYKGMDISTAKARPEELKAPLYGVDLVDIDVPYSAQLFQEYARETIAQLPMPVICCGGTGLYLKAVIDEMDFPAFEEDNSNQDAPRQRYQNFLDKEGTEALHALLKEKDPESAACIHPHNTRRVIRALEMLEEGCSYAQQKAGLHEPKPYYKTLILGLAWPRETLYQRINQRVDQMFEEGLVAEYQTLKQQEVFSSTTAAQAIGYKELAEYEGDLSLAAEKIKQNTRRYAKRQLTWFYKDSRIQWFNGELPVQELLSEVLRYLAYEVDTARS